MSWTVYTPNNEPINRSAIPDLTGQPQTQPADVGEAYLEHLEAAKEAAEILADVVGRHADQISVTMSGHANPGHAPCSGWADEFITITVTARPKR